MQVTRKRLVYVAFTATFVTSSLLCIRRIPFNQGSTDNHAKADVVTTDGQQENLAKVADKTGKVVSKDVVRTERRTENGTRDKTLSKDTGKDRYNDVTIESFENIIKQRDSQEKVRKFPDVIGIGVKKCGTGALAHFLSLHPLLALPTRRVETFFFSTFFAKGMRWYRNLMPRVSKSVHVMEKTPSYFYSTATVPNRIKQSLPNAKLILSLCDPVLRSFSDFFHERYNPKQAKNSSEYAGEFDDEAQTFLKSVAQPDKSLEYVARLGKAQCNSRGSGKSCVFSKGIYHHYLSQWLRLYNESQLLVVNGDRWISDPGHLIEEIQEFIGIPVLLRREDFVRPYNGSFYCFRRWWQARHPAVDGHVEVVTKEPDGDLFCLGPGKGRTRNGVRSMFNGTYAKLKEFYRPHNERLYRMLGREFGW